MDLTYSPRYVDNFSQVGLGLQSARSQVDAELRVLAVSNTTTKNNNRDSESAEDECLFVQLL
jgi:hypothetical protein